MNSKNIHTLYKTFSQLTKRGMTGYDWQELLDPVTDTYFYYDACSGAVIFVIEIEKSSQSLFF